MHANFATRANVSLFGRKEDERACRVAFSGRVHDERFVSDSPGDVQTLFKGAAAGLDLQAH